MFKEEDNLSKKNMFKEEDKIILWIMGISIGIEL